MVEAEDKFKEETASNEETDHWDIILRNAVTFQYLWKEGIWLSLALKKYST